MAKRTQAFAATLIICASCAGLDGRQTAGTATAARILGAAEAQASNLKSIDRAYAYWLLSRIYQKLKPAEESRLLKAGCQTAISTNADDADTAFKEKIEYDCLQRMIATQPGPAAILLSQADPNVRQQINAGQATGAAKTGNMEAALEMLSSDISQGAQYPYSRAVAVMAELPADDRNDRDRIFAQALSVFRQHRAKRASVGMEDLGTIIALFWRDLSPGLVLEGANELLDAAQADDAGDTHLEITVSSRSAAHSFASLYQYRLFQLLPVLKELDPSGAERLLRENQQVADLQQRGHVDPALGLTLNRRTGPVPASAGIAEELTAIQLRRQAEEILQSGRDDPAGSLARAEALPNNIERGRSIKAELLARLSQTIARDNEALATQGLDYLARLTDSYPPLVRCRYLVQIGEQYSRTGKMNKLRDVVNQGIQAVIELYQRDTNSDDPNRALKSSWPSTVVSRAFVALAARVSPRFAEETLLQLPDPDLQVFDRIELAATLLAVPSYPSLIQERRKEGNSYSTQVFDMPSAPSAEK